MESLDGQLPSSSVPLVVEVNTDAAWVRVRLVGELALDTAEDFSDAIDDLVQRSYRDLVVDLKQLQFCDAKGLRALLRADTELELVGGHVLYANPSPHLRRLLAISRVDQALDLVREPDADGLR